MLRQLIALTAITVCATTFAAEPKQFTASISVKVVNNGETTEIKTNVSGTHGQPLETKVGAKNDTSCSVTINEVAGSNPRQYVAAFKLTKRDSVLLSPTLVTLADKTAQIFVGEEDGDHAEIELVVREKWTE